MGDFGDRKCQNSIYVTVLRKLDGIRTPISDLSFLWADLTSRSGPNFSFFFFFGFWGSDCRGNEEGGRDQRKNDSKQNGNRGRGGGDQGRNFNR